MLMTAVLKIMGCYIFGLTGNRQIAFLNVTFFLNILIFLLNEQNTHSSRR